MVTVKQSISYSVIRFVKIFHFGKIIIKRRFLHDNRKINTTARK
nr:MAG TPA: hypothetical protein [Caudoviricetes sp.]